MNEFSPEFCHNEREVESKLIVSYLLPALGYDISMWRQEKRTHRFRLDFVAYPPKSAATQAYPIVIEAKHPRKNLKPFQYQLKNYMLALDVEYGVLTNGKELIIYQRASQYTIKSVFHCATDELVHQLARIKCLIGRDRLFAQEQFEQFSQDCPNTQIFSTTPKDMEGSPMKILAVYHNKGGVGKTTTVVNVAAALASRGKKVLIVDLDSQANSTYATGLVNFGDEEKDDLKQNYIYHVLKNKDAYSITEVARTSRYSNHPVDVIPAHIHLMEHEDELNRLDFSRGILWKKLYAVRDKYDVILIDTPPSLNLYARIGLITAEYLLIPSDLKPFANEGLENVKKFTKEIDGFKDMINLPPLQIIGVLPTKVPTNPRFVTKTLKTRITNIQERYAMRVLEDCIIYERDDLAKCIEPVTTVGELDIADPRSIFDFKPHSKSANEFEVLAETLLKEMGIAS